VIELLPVPGLPELAAGDDLAGMIRERVALRPGDVVVVAQKAVSKVEGRVVELETVAASDAAVRLASAGDDPRVLEVVLRESAVVVRHRPGLVISRTRHGFVCANAGVDRSNSGGVDRVVLLPVDPDRSARNLNDALGDGVAVIVSDSFGRPFRQGITGVALGCSGLEPLVSWVGHRDDQGRALRTTVEHVADALAAAAGLVQGASGGVPVVVIRGYRFQPGTRGAASTVMSAERDLFAGGGMSP
jgi:coenzyme F420-0:L-glutamate ligase/coenzyme F420-1:gamma-L-glutamate ligase